MDHTEETTARVKNHFAKLLQKKSIHKADLITLKQQTRSLAEVNSYFKSLCSRITTQVNGMKHGILDAERRIKVHELYHEYFE